MPIRAENRSLYPRDWKAISLAVKERADWKCEGSPAYPDCRAAHGKLHRITKAKVILTTAHLNHDPSDCTRENLRAWCQRCHITYDMPHRQKNAARTRREAMAQMDLVDALHPRFGGRP